MNRALLLLIISIFNCTTANIQTANIRETLHYILTESDENTLIICNVDLPNMAHVYQLSHEEIEKKAKLAAPADRKNAIKIIATLKTFMETMNPMYVAVARLAQNVIGVTQRSLRWAHILNQACEQEEIHNQPTRYAIVIPANEKTSREAREIECNANIIYLEHCPAANAIYHYITTWSPACSKIILIDTDEATLRTWAAGLSELQAPPVTAILTHH